MTFLFFFFVIFLVAYCAGLLGSLVGLGGGIVIIPVFTLLLNIDIRYAVGASLIASIATSSGAASAYIKEGITNIRLGMFLEVATTIGATCGTLLALYLNNNIIAIVFGLILILTSVMNFRKKEEYVLHKGSEWAKKLKLNGTYPVEGKIEKYYLSKVGMGFIVMGIAGAVSGLLGIGAGVLKVIAMDNTMKVPFKVSTTTSNFMIGVTATAGAVVYWQRGYMEPVLVCPILIGVLCGAFTGARLLKYVRVRILRIIFACIALMVAIQMIVDGALGKF